MLDEVLDPHLSREESVAKISDLNDDLFIEEDDVDEEDDDEEDDA